MPRIQSKALKSHIEDGAVIDMVDVPDELLNERQQRVKAHTLADNVFFDEKNAAAELAAHKLPAYFLDFETIQFAVPIWKGTRPYQQITFQFSLHTLSASGKLAQTGFLDGNDMATSFRLLRSNSLIWNYFEHSYLLGEPLKAFDVLFWNMDTTRMPAAMHSFYLRQMYLHNNLVKPDALTIGGELIDLTRITQPLYAVSCADDHIVPWQQSYRIRHHVNEKTSVRYVLSTSGHIFGIVNPVVNPPKRSFWVAEPTSNETSEHWLARAPKAAGSWWPDWLAWLAPQCGPMVDAPNVKVKTYPDLGQAPGTYVFES